MAGRNLWLHGVATLALMTAAPSAFAQTVNQTVDNSGAVTGTLGDKITITGPVSGAGTSSQISSTGAAAATSIGGIGQDFSETGLGTVTQKANNTGHITTPGINGTSISTSAGVSSHGHGASLSVSSTGAVSSTAVTGIGNVVFSDVSIGSIEQSTTNTGAVETGQASTVNNPGNGTPRGQISASKLNGDGSAASVSSTGSASSVGTSFIRSEGGSVEVGSVGQSTSTSGAGTTRNWGHISASGQQTGRGATFSISTSGAISSVSSTNIGSIGSVATSFGAITQETEASASTTNQGRFNLNTNADFMADGISASISATAAGSIVSSTSIGAVGHQASFGAISQTTDATAGATVKNSAFVTHRGDLAGDGTSVSASATGSVSSVGATAIASSAVDFNFSTISQNSTNMASVRNDSLGNFLTSSANPNGSDLGITGSGASASISATGAAAVVGTTFINSSISNLDIGTINSTARNSGAVINNNSDTDRTWANESSNVSPALGTGTLRISEGNISGAGASVSISATGAVASTSITSIANPVAPTDIDVGSVTQNAYNLTGGSITNYGGTITTLETGKGSISGSGASASISASGATAAFAVTSIADSAPLGGIASIGPITQTASNVASVTNSGAINLTGGITGAGASASISAVGAGAYVSFSAIKGP